MTRQTGLGQQWLAIVWFEEVKRGSHAPAEPGNACRTLDWIGSNVVTGQSQERTA